MIARRHCLARQQRFNRRDKGYYYTIRPENFLLKISADRQKMQFGIYSLSYISPAAESHREGAGGFDAASFETTQRRKIGPKSASGKGEAASPHTGKGPS